MRLLRLPERFPGPMSPGSLLIMCTVARRARTWTRCLGPAPRWRDGPGSSTLRRARRDADLAPGLHVEAMQLDDERDDLDRMALRARLVSRDPRPPGPLADGCCWRRVPTLPWWVPALAGQRLVRDVRFRGRTVPTSPQTAPFVPPRCLAPGDPRSPRRAPRMVDASRIRDGPSFRAVRRGGRVANRAPRTPYLTLVYTAHFSLWGYSRWLPVQPRSPRDDPVGKTPDHGVVGLVARYCPHPHLPQWHEMGAFDGSMSPGCRARARCAPGQPRR